MTDTGRLTGSRERSQSSLSSPVGFDPSRLEELAERCEKATGHDGELDAMIAVAVDFIAENSNPSSARALHSDFGGNNSYSDIALHWPRLLRYTASLDAAMTLVPQGFGWWFSCGKVRPNGEPPEANESFAMVWQHIDHERFRAGDERHGKIANPALALCAAALRACAVLAPPSEPTEK